MRDLTEIIEALEPIISAESVVHDRDHTTIMLTPDEYTDACNAIGQLKLVDMLKQQKAVSALPKLVAAVEAALRVPLPVSIRRQLEKAIVIASK